VLDAVCGDSGQWVNYLPVVVRNLQTYFLVAPDYCFWCSRLTENSFFLVRKKKTLLHLILLSIIRDHNESTTLILTRHARKIDKF
jgi:hypothetical protein